MTVPSTLFILLLLLLGTSIYFLDRKHRLSPFLFRRSHETMWRKAIAEEDFQKVDSLLSELMRVFLLPVDWRYRLKPSDDLHAMMKRHTHWGPYGFEDHELVQYGKSAFGTDFTPYFESNTCQIRDLVGAIATINGSATNDLKKETTSS